MPAPRPVGGDNDNGSAAGRRVGGVVINGARAALVALNIHRPAMWRGDDVYGVSWVRVVRPTEIVGPDPSPACGEIQMQV